MTDHRPVNWETYSSRMTNKRMALAASCGMLKRCAAAHCRRAVTHKISCTRPDHRRWPGDFGDWQVLAVLPRIAIRKSISTANRYTSTAVKLQGQGVYEQSRVHLCTTDNSARINSGAEVKSSCRHA